MTQPPVGQLPQPEGTADDPAGPPAVTAVKRRNAYAITGVVLAVLIWPLGLIFSIIGLVKSRKRGGSGKTLSIVGIVLSLAYTIPFVVAAVVVYHDLPRDDPGCVAESDQIAIENTFTADENAMFQDQGTPAERADAQLMVGHAQTLQSELTIAAAQARQPPVRAAIGVMTRDLSTMMSSLQAVLHGNANDATQVVNADSALIGASTSLISLCPPGV